MDDLGEMEFDELNRSDIESVLTLIEKELGHPVDPSGPLESPLERVYYALASLSANNDEHPIDCIVLTERNPIKAHNLKQQSGNGS